MRRRDPPERHREAALRLLVWARAFFSRGAVEDVVVWWNGQRWRFAFIGPPMRLSRAFRLGEDPKSGESFAQLWPINYGADPFHRRRGRMAVTLDAAFGVEDGGNGQLEDARVYPHDALDAIGAYLREFLGEGDRHGERASDVTLIPRPGHPWVGPGTSYWSASTRRLVVPKRPVWVAPKPIPVFDPDTGKDPLRPVVDWCAFAPRLSPGDAWGGPLSLQGPGGVPVMVSHAFSLWDGADRTDAAKENRRITRAMARCGGLLFPSIAVGPIPAPQYLPGVLYFDPRLVTGELAPLRGRRPARVKVYNSDAWTATTGAIVSRYAAHLYDELTGAIDPGEFMESWRNHLFSMGLPEVSPGEGWASDDLRRIDTVAGTLRVAAMKARAWPASATRSQASFDRVFAQNRERNGLEAYPFLEAKADGIVTLACVRIACVPDFDARRYTRWLRAAGYKGPVALVPTDATERQAVTAGKNRDGLELYRFRYALRAAEVARAATAE